MPKRLEIDRAIDAHGLWRARLQMAIETGKFDHSVDRVCRDSECEFGRWLFGPTLTEEDRATEDYRKVRDLHADYHRCAGRVIELVLSGKKAEAERMIAVGGEHAAISALLTQALMEWKSRIAAA